MTYASFMLTPASKILSGLIPADPEDTAEVAEYARSSGPTFVLMGINPGTEKWKFIAAEYSVPWVLRRARMILGSGIDWDGTTILIFGRFWTESQKNPVDIELWRTYNEEEFQNDDQSHATPRNK